MARTHALATAALSLDKEFGHAWLAMPATLAVSASHVQSHEASIQQARVATDLPAIRIHSYQAQHRANPSISKEVSQ